MIEIARIEPRWFGHSSCVGEVIPTHQFSSAWHTPDVNQHVSMPVSSEGFDPNSSPGVSALGDISSKTGPGVPAPDPSACKRSISRLMMSPMVSIEINIGKKQ